MSIDLLKEKGLTLKRYEAEDIPQKSLQKQITQTI